MSFNWDDETSLLLIKKFQENEILWTPSHPDYKNRKKRADKLKKIAKIFGSDVDSNEIERKLKNLTSHYYREKKKFDETRKTCTEKDDRREPKWFAYKALDFLQNKNRPAQTQKNGKSLADSETEATFNSRKRNRNLDDDVTEWGATNELRDRPSAVRDDASVFGEYIATKIRPMDAITSSTVQHLIQNIIYQAEMGVYCQMQSSSSITPAYFTTTTLRRSSSQSDL